MNHVLSCVLVAVALATCTVLCWPNVMSDKTQSRIFFSTTSFFFTFVAVLLLFSLVNLWLTFRRDLPGELTQELRRIVVFLVYYSIFFSVRSVAIILVHFGYWPQFNRDWENETYDPFDIALWAIQFIVYSCIPIIYMTVIHFMNFNTDQRASKMIEDLERDTL